MKTKIYNSDLSELIIEADYPHRFKSPENIIQERSFNADKFLGQGTYQELFFEGIHIGYGDISLSNTTLLQFESDFETVEMHFALSGNKVTKSNSFGREVRFKDNQHNLFYINGFEGNLEWSDDRAIKVFEVNLLPSFFQRYLPEGSVFDLFREGILSKKTSTLLDEHYPIIPEMLWVIQRVMNCDRKGMFRRMYLEAQVIELLMLQLEQISSFRKAHTSSKLKRSEIEKLHAVKDIITGQIDKPCSLIGLAQQVGTNEFYLKKGFKELFGTTVFGFWNQLKMERAQEMLIVEEMTITEVSEQAGYKNPQHFSTAFKKRYGFSPKDLRTID